MSKLVNSAFIGSARVQTMARYFFHITSENCFNEDTDGFDLVAVDGTYSEVFAAARTMVAKLILFEEPIDGLSFEVTDEWGKLVATIPFHSVAQSAG